MTASSPVLDTESKWAFDCPSGWGASAAGLMMKSSGDDPRGVALYTIVRPSGMNRALVIGSLSKVRASKLTTLDGAGRCLPRRHHAEGETSRHGGGHREHRPPPPRGRCVDGRRDS